jgi:predicted NodU family carbamoyl transferase
LLQVLRPLPSLGAPKRSLVLVGGCALNVRFNDLVRRTIGIDVRDPPTCRPLALCARLRMTGRHARSA